MPGDATELQVRNKLIERRQGQILEETKAVAQEYAEYNIRVNSVHPGAVSPPGIEADDIKDVVQAYVEQIPMKRIGDPEEVSNLVLFLACLLYTSPSPRD